MTSQVQTKKNDINEARRWALEWDKQLIEARIEALRRAIAEIDESIKEITDSCLES